MSKRPSAPTTTKKLHRVAERRNKKTAIVTVLGIGAVVLMMLIPKFLPAEKSKKVEPQVSPKEKAASEPKRIALAQVSWAEGEARFLGKSEKIKKKDWLWDGDGVAVGDESSVSLRLKSGVRLDLPPGTSIKLGQGTNLVSLLEGAITVDSRKQTNPESVVAFEVDRGHRSFSVKPGTLALFFLSPCSTSQDGASKSDTLSIHVWQGEVNDQVLGAVLGKNSRILVRSMTEKHGTHNDFKINLKWKEAQDAKAGTFTVSGGDLAEEISFVHQDRSQLDPRLRLLCDDLAEQVVGISQGTRLDVDLMMLLQERAILDDGLRLEGAKAEDPEALVSFVEANGDVLTQGTLGSVLGKLPESRKPRARRILAHRVLAQSKEPSDLSHVKIEVSQASISKLMKAYVAFPRDFETKHVWVRKEALANQKILVDVLGDLLDFRVEKSRWGYALVEK